MDFSWKLKKNFNGPLLGFLWALNGLIKIITILYVTKHKSSNGKDTFGNPKKKKNSKDTFKKKVD